MRKILIITLILSACGGAQAQYTADTYKQKVLEYSKEYKMAQAYTQTTAEKRAFIGSHRLPQVDLSADFNYQVNPGNFGGQELEAIGYSAEIGISQVVFAGGSIQRQFKAAKMEEEMAVLNQNYNESAILMMADMTYWRLVAMNDFYTVAQKFDSLVNALLSVVKKRFDEGMISKTDLLKLETRKYEAQMQISACAQNYLAALQKFNTLIGTEPNTPVTITENITRPVAEQILSPIDEVLSLRADYLALLKQVDMQYQLERATAAKYNPQLYIGAKEVVGTSAINIDGNSSFNTVAYAQLTFPIFSWGARSREVNIAKITTSTTDLQREALRDNIAQELSNTWTNLNETKKQIDISSLNFRTSFESLALHTLSYNEGSIPILDVLSAQMSWLQAGNSLVSSYLNHKIAVAQYLKACGK